jgi:hypothetical protein
MYELHDHHEDDEVQVVVTGSGGGGEAGSSKRKYQKSVFQHQTVRIFHSIVTTFSYVIAES